MNEYYFEKTRLLEDKLKHQEKIIDSYKLLYSIQDSLLQGKGLQNKEIAMLEYKVNMMYEGYVKK